MGRTIGTTSLSLTAIKKIIDMTKDGKSRTEIADSVQRSKKTVYNYQVKYNVL